MINSVTEAFEKGVEYASKNAYEWLMNNLNNYILIIDNKFIIVEDFKEQFCKAIYNNDTNQEKRRVDFESE
jgi:hypothetical protein